MKKLNEKDMELVNTFKKQLLKILTYKNIKTDAQLLKEIDISQSRFSLLKNGNAVPKVSELMMLSDYFKIPIEYFIKSDNYQFPSNTIDWKSCTFKDAIEVLIEMSNNYLISFSHNIDDEYEVSFSELMIIKLIDSEYVAEKLYEWERLSAPFMDEISDFNTKMLNYLKKGFIEELSKDPIYDFPFYV